MGSERGREAALTGLVRIRFLWVVLAVLGGFVIFVELIADVGGSAEPLTLPPGRPSQASETPAAETPSLGTPVVVETPEP